MNVINKFFVSIFFTLCAVNSAFAIDLPESMRQTMARETVGMPSLLNLVVSMVIVIAMIYFTGWVYNKLNIVNRDKLKKLAKNDSDIHRFTVLQSMPLGQQRHLYSIEMNGKILLVGSTPSHINLIKEFDKTPDSQQASFEEPQKEEYTKAEEQIRKAVDIDELYKKYKK